MPTRIDHSHHRANVPRFDVASLKARVPLSDLAGRMTKLKPASGGAKGLCPFHDEKTPSFFVDDAKGLWHCFGCGRGGDAVSLLLEAGADGFLDACGQLAEAGGVGSARSARTTATNADPHRSRVALARREWRSTRAVAGTPAERYLAARGLAGNAPGSLRYGMTPTNWDERTGAAGPRRPALIAAAQDVDGRITGIQRVFVDPDRRGFPFRPLRLSLGRIRGSALRLGPVREEIMLTGSVEDGLALMHMFVGATVWSSLGESNLAGVVLPPIVTSLILYGDADEPGRAAAARADGARGARGARVRTVSALRQGRERRMDRAQWVDPWLNTCRVHRRRSLGHIDGLRADCIETLKHKRGGEAASRNLVPDLRLGLHDPSSAKNLGKCRVGEALPLQLRLEKPLGALTAATPNGRHGKPSQPKIANTEIIVADPEINHVAAPVNRC